MAYRPRLLDPDAIYFVTSRTIDGRLFLRPSRETNNAIGAVLADAQARFGAEIYEFVFLSNHMHLAVRCPNGQLPEFMQYVKANIAVLVNRALGRRGHLWERRYMASPILDEDAQVERAIYIYGHGVKEGLVERSTQWPGLASVKQRLTGSSLTFERVDQAGLTRDRLNRKHPPDPAKYKRRVRIELTPWPFLRYLDDREARARTAQLVASAEERAAEDRSRTPAIGVKQVLAQDPWSRPERALKRTPNPICHATSPRQRLEYRAGYSQFLADHGRASRSFRAGELNVAFPRHSFPPPLALSWSRARYAGPADLPPH